MFCWSGRVLRIDLSKREVSVETSEPNVMHLLGGRGINVKILHDEVTPSISAFDPANRLVFGPGVLTGTPAPAASRMAVTTLLPNGFVGSSSIGGFIGAEIRHTGYDNIIIQGRSDNPVYVFIHDNEVDFNDAGSIWGKDTQDTQEIIKKELGDPDVQVMCIGPAAENLVTFSSIMTGLQSAAGHGGYGSVLGSKNLKAVAVRGKRGVSIAHLDDFLDVCLDTRNSIIQNPAVQAMCAAGDKNQIFYAVAEGQAVFGNYEAPDSNSETAADWSRRAEEFWNQCAVGKIGCYGCPMFHFDVFNVPDVGIVAPKCTGLGLSFATRLWNNDYKLMLQASALCNNHGLDFTSTTNIIAFLMELYHHGIITEHDTDGIPMKRGDKEAIISTIHRIAHQEGFGRLFRGGLLDAARTIGKGAEQYAMHVKGLEMSATEPRIFKTAALAYALCKDVIDAPPIIEGMGGIEKETAEKLAFQLVGSREASHKDTYEKKGHLTWDSENRATALDLLGMCRYFFLSMGIFLDVPAKLFSLATGVDMDESGLLTAAQRVRTLERAFNVTKGIERKDDSLPERLFEVAVPQGQFEGTKLDKKMFDTMVDDYYATSGWDENGIPKEETFNKLGLVSEWKIFKDRMEQKGATP